MKPFKEVEMLSTIVSGKWIFKILVISTPKG